MHVCVLVRRISAADISIHPLICWMLNHAFAKKKKKRDLVSTFNAAALVLCLHHNYCSLRTDLIFVPFFKTVRFLLVWYVLWGCGARRRRRPRGDFWYCSIYSTITNSMHRSRNMRGTNDRERAPVFACTSGVQCKRAFFGQGSYAEALVRLF